MAEGLRDRLIGAWELQEYTASGRDDRLPGGRGRDWPDHLLDRGRVHVGSADGAGTAAVCLRRHGRRHAEEQRAATAGTSPTRARSPVDEASRTLKHHVSVCLLPNWIGDSGAVRPTGGRHPDALRRSQSSRRSPGTAERPSHSTSTATSSPRVCRRGACTELSAERGK